MTLHIREVCSLPASGNLIYAVCRSRILAAGRVVGLWPDFYTAIQIILVCSNMRFFRMTVTQAQESM